MGWRRVQEITESNTESHQGLRYVTEELNSDKNRPITQREGQSKGVRVTRVAMVRNVGICRDIISTPSPGTMAKANHCHQGIFRNEKFGTR